IERFLITLTDSLSESDLLVARDQRIRADVTQVLIERAFLVRRFLVVARGGHEDSGSLVRNRGVRAADAATAFRVTNGLIYQCTRSPTRCQRIRVSHAKSTVSGA